MTQEILDFTGLSHDAIREKLAAANIPLTPEEILRIQTEFLGRPPTLAECILFSIEGSEHCSYKSSRVHLKQFITDGPDVVLGAKEDAGVVAVASDREGHRWCIVMSHESHNHPSQIVPYEGAATGVGGNVRDVCCMGAEVIAVADALRFGDIHSNKTKWIHDGVVAGIGGYGNPLGIPNIAGDIYYHSGYNDNCLVNVVTLGLVREDRIFHSYAPENAEDYDLILVGKPTDNSGFGGASFASLELEEEKREQNKGAVQEPNAFLERHLLKATYQLFRELAERDDVSRVGFKDLGAGGVACASVELAETTGYGAEVFLDRVPVSMRNLHPSITLCSETQERFMWVSPPDLTDKIIDHYNRVYDLPAVSNGARAQVIGKIRGDGQYIVHYRNEEIVNADAAVVTRGFLYQRLFADPDRTFREPSLSEPEDYTAILMQLLAHENIASREPVFKTYDKQVQGRTGIESGQADAGVMLPFNSEDYPEEIRATGIALSVDHNPRYGEIDPYWGAVNAVVEAMRNVAAVGAHPVAMTDCLCFGNPEKPAQMWEFVEATRGVAETCKSIHLAHHPNHPTPIIAGNVSFYNESKTGAIPASPIISCLGTMPDGHRAVTMGFKSTGSLVIMVGDRRDECGGSTYYALRGETGANLPRPDLKIAEAQIHTVAELIQAGKVLAAHDISDGGLAVALAEMTFEYGIGCEADVPGDLRPDKLLFSETGGFLLEVAAAHADEVRERFSASGLTARIIGRTTDSETITINTVINLDVSRARAAWSTGLQDKL
ncbi:MAG: phosphoribosylformylglycinamidine synthase subunit PurL [Fidelibacterota bacterium]